MSAAFGAEPVAVFFGAVARFSGWSSLGASVFSTLFTAYGRGLDSAEFRKSAGSTLLGLITFGQSGLIKKLGDFDEASKATQIGTAITQFGHDLISPITSLLS
ncbi:hypothetical protein [Streptomyces albofaciens]|uniref:hypothetical protein n=1 Tax=Streptomyces albofaciens TaxID=66866 RepID=UPI001FCB7AF6|nr:hypothetical protein [Streptomyces albofaciens]